jgi:hypothetical protein
MRLIVVASAITARRAIKRDLYTDVSARIVAELEAGNRRLGEIVGLQVLTRTRRAML